MENRKITVFGASGKIGSLLISNLSEAGIETIAVTRNLNHVNHLPFVQWVRADMASKESLYKTMENASAVFLLSGHSPNFVSEQRNVIEVAKEQGIPHLVKLSSAAADKNSPYLISRVHGEVEEMLKESGISATLLRPTGMMQNWLGELAHSVRTEKKIYDATGEGKRAYIDIRDIAEVAFRILADPARHACHAYYLTGGKAVNYYGIAEVISRNIGEQVQFISLGQEEMRRRMKEQGKPGFVIDTLLAYAEQQLQGRTAEVSDDVAGILGRQARTVEDFFADYKDAFC